MGIAQCLWAPQKGKPDDGWLVPAVEIVPELAGYP